jgi:spermidine synthase
MLLRFLQRAWSHFAPLRMAAAQGRSGELVVRWERGRLVLNSAHANQSFGSLHRVWQEVLRARLAAEGQPQSVLLLGLGGGSVPRILRRELGCAAPITAVEIDAAMIHLARAHFGLDAVTGLTVVEGDAIVHVHAIAQRFHWVLVDLFDDLDLARGTDTLGFALALRDRCAGTLCFNTVGYDTASERRCQRVKEHLLRVFGTVDEMRLEDVNRVFIAR